jgi:hypothetical protein
MADAHVGAIIHNKSSVAVVAVTLKNRYWFRSSRP